MKCPKCKTINSNEAFYCLNCGFDLENIILNSNKKILSKINWKDFFSNY